jgi:uncharacterized protein YjbJ (UPF0337 family)
MNQDVFAGHWKEMRGKLRSWWANLTDDDFAWIGGEKDRLIGLVQQKYGYTRDQAQNEVDRRLSEYDTTMLGSSAQYASAKLNELGQNVAEKAREARSAMSNGVETATSYWRENEFGDIADDVVALVRRHPIPALLIALAIGYTVARSAFNHEKY